MQCQRSITLFAVCHYQSATGFQFVVVRRRSTSSNLPNLLLYPAEMLPYALVTENVLTNALSRYEFTSRRRRDCDIRLVWWVIFAQVSTLKPAWTFRKFIPHRKLPFSCQEKGTSQQDVKCPFERLAAVHTAQPLLSRGKSIHVKSGIMNCDCRNVLQFLFWFSTPQISSYCLKFLRKRNRKKTSRIGVEQLKSYLELVSTHDGGVRKIWRCSLQMHPSFLPSFLSCRSARASTAHSLRWACRLIILILTPTPNLTDD